MTVAGSKSKGMLLQFAGVLILLGGLRGFFVLEGVPYFSGVVVAVIVFAMCLVRGGALARQDTRNPGGAAKRSILLATSWCSALALGATAGMPPSHAAGWQEFTFVDDGFAVSARWKPELSKRPGNPSIGSGEVHMYRVRVGQAELSVSVATTPPLTRTPRESLTGARDGLAQATKGRIAAESVISLGPYPGLQFDLEAERYHARIRLFLIERRLYQLLSIAPSGLSLASETGRFFDSFRAIPSH